MPGKSLKPALDAEILRLYEEERLRQRSIGGRLGISESVVSKRLQRIYARRAEEEWNRNIRSDD